MDCKEPTALCSCPADTTFISLCDSDSGIIGALTIDENYECGITGILIDTITLWPTIWPIELMMMMISVWQTWKHDFCALQKAIADNFEAVHRPVRLHFWLYKWYIERKLQ
jgi:hypothetical protein